MISVFGLCLLAAVALPAANSLYSAQKPVTVAYNRDNGVGYAYNTDTTLAPFARTAKGNQPEQVNLVYQSPTSIVVSWVMGEAQMSGNASIVQPNLNGIQAIVQYASKNDTKELTATGKSSFYSQNYNLPNTANYTSGIINTAVLSGLTPDTEYYYRVGDGKNWSQPLEFKTLQAVGPTFTPYRIGIVADLGITDNSTITFQHLKESFPDLVLLDGDFNYANNLLTNGTIAGQVNYTGPGQTYQPVWDQFYRWWSTLTSEVPFLASPGNHEYEQQADNSTYASYNARFQQPSNLSGSGTSKYYSVDLPGIHLITLSAYDQYNASSPQYTWLQQDLANFKRSVTPWLIVMFHPPMYNTYMSHFKEVECLRLAIEPMLYQYGVDLVLAGHVHSYERTNRVYNYTNDPCGPTYITIGDGGNLETLAFKTVDQNGTCPTPSLAASPGSTFTGNCQWNSYQAADAGGQNNGYCPPAQPAWSAYREPSFGHGVLDIMSADKMVWSWHRNQDAEPVQSDIFEFTQKDASCKSMSGVSASSLG